jgi:hypothetical protein
MAAWYEPPGHGDGVSAMADRATYEATMARFAERAPDDPLAASRALVRDLFDGYARRQGKRGWVEMTPTNARFAPYLAAMFPDLRMVNVIRDGRDVASSLVSLGWQPDAETALGWWESRMQLSHDGCRDLDADSFLTVRFERLLVDDRAAGFDDLRDFFAWPNDEIVRRYFDRRMPSQLANVGRWRTHFSPPEQTYVAAEYERALERLRGAGVPTP